MQQLYLVYIYALEITTMPTINKVIRPWQSQSKKIYKTKSGRKSTDATDPFYLSTQWKKVRALHLSTNPLCRHCERIGRLTAANIVDHIKPRQHGGAELDIDNLQSLCLSCHTRKTNKDRYLYNQKDHH